MHPSAYPPGVVHNVFGTARNPRPVVALANQTKRDVVAVAELGASKPDAEVVERLRRTLRRKSLAPVLAGEIPSLSWVPPFQRDVPLVVRPQPERAKDASWEAAKRDVELARMSACAIGADRLIVFDISYTSDDDGNFAAVTYWLIFPIYFVPGMTTEYKGTLRAAVIDVPSGGVVTYGELSAESSLVHLLLQGRQDAARGILFDKLIKDVCLALRPGLDS